MIQKEMSTVIANPFVTTYLATYLSNVNIFVHTAIADLLLGLFCSINYIFFIL